MRRCHRRTRLAAALHPTDLDTWRRWRAVDFRGEDIAWAVIGLRGSAGPQRLLVLRRKLRKLLGDLGYGDR